MNKKELNLIKIILFLLLNELIYHNHIKKVKFKVFFNASDQENSVLIVLFETYHFECLPGIINYFNNLRFKVHILIKSNTTECLEKLKPSKYIKIFEYIKKYKIN